MCLDDDDDTVLARVQKMAKAKSRLVNSVDVNPETRPPKRMVGASKLICRAQVTVEWKLRCLVTQSSKKKITTGRGIIKLCNARGVPNHRVLICDRGRFSVRDVLMKRLLSRC